MSSNAYKGRNLLLKVGTGTSPDVFTSVGGIRTTSFRINNELVDVTTMVDAPWRRALGDAGMRSVSFSGNGVYENDAATKKMLDLALDGTLEDFQLLFADALIGLQGQFVVTSFEFAGSYNNEQTFNVSMESGGEIQVVTFPAS